MRLPTALVLGLVSLLATGVAGAGPEKPAGPAKPDRGGKANIPEAASEGPRDFASLVAPLKAFVTGQPYGKEWKEIVHTEPAPKDPKGLGQAATHPALKNDRIEMQQQVQYLEPTSTVLRYGWVSISAVRVYRYGRLAAAQVVFERIGRPEQDRAPYLADVNALADALKAVRAALELGPEWKIRQNDLVTEREKTAAQFEKSPLRIEIEPVKVPAAE